MLLNLFWSKCFFVYGDLSNQHNSEFIKLIVLLTVYQSTCLVFPCDILFSEDCKAPCCLFQDKDYLLEHEQLQVWLRMEIFATRGGLSYKMDGDTRRKLSKEPLRDTNQVDNKSRKVDFNVFNVDFIDGCLRVKLIGLTRSEN